MHCIRRDISRHQFPVVGLLYILGLIYDVIMSWPPLIAQAIYVWAPRLFSSSRLVLETMPAMVVHCWPGRRERRGDLQDLFKCWQILTRLLLLVSSRHIRTQRCRDQIIWLPVIAHGQVHFRHRLWFGFGKLEVEKNVLVI